MFEPPAPQPKGKRGPKPKKGARQPTLHQRRQDPNTVWISLKVTWYGGQKKTAWNFGNADDPKYNKLWEDITTETDEAKRTKLFKEAFAYGTSQFFYIAGPTRSNYRVWQPWIKSYQGENCLQAVAYSPTVARVWIDQDLKRKMTGKK